ncbi:MAG: DUF3592 domain-containing protein [Candidatus Obscuribacter sp.]|nr:DUF3592 domain-containing protein [Candidatus Obscuribacter sp.]
MKTMFVQFIVVTLLLLNFFLGERGLNLTITFQRRPVVWSALTGILSTYWLYLACNLFHKQVPFLNNLYVYIRRPSDTYHIEIALFVGLALCLLCYFLRGWLTCFTEVGNMPTASPGAPPPILRVAPSGPGEIGGSLKGLMLTLLVVLSIFCGLDLYRSQVMIDRWIKIAGKVQSLNQSSSWDAKNGRHNYLSVDIQYWYQNQAYTNTLSFRDVEITPALKRYSKGSAVVLLCNPQDVSQSVVEQERNISARSSTERQLLLVALSVMLLVWFIPNRFFDMGLNGKLAGDYQLVGDQFRRL